MNTLLSIYILYHVLKHYKLLQNFPKPPCTTKLHQRTMINNFLKPPCTTKLHQTTVIYNFLKPPGRTKLHQKTLVYNFHKSPCKTKQHQKADANDTNLWNTFLLIDIIFGSIEKETFLKVRRKGLQIE